MNCIISSMVEKTVPIKKGNERTILNTGDGVKKGNNSNDWLINPSNERFPFKFFSSKYNENLTEFLAERSLDTNFW